MELYQLILRCESKGAAGEAPAEPMRGRPVRSVAPKPDNPTELL